MYRNWEIELENRVKWLREILEETKAKGFVYGNSGGKDCTLVSILCKRATDNVVGVVMPCSSSRNYGIDREHAYKVAQQYSIKTLEVDLSEVKSKLKEIISEKIELLDLALANINPRLRMTTLYTIGQSLGYLVAGTGNRSEAVMGYFTKFGDGAYDLNVIADLTVTEVFEFLRYIQKEDGTDLSFIIEKAPSAGLWEGQTDEEEMGLSYKDLDKYLLTGEATEKLKNRIDGAYLKTEHKRQLPKTYGKA